MSKLVIHNKASDGQYFSNEIRFIGQDLIVENGFLDKFYCSGDKYKIVADSYVNFEYQYQPVEYINKFPYKLFMSDLLENKKVSSKSEIITDVGVENAYLAIFTPRIDLTGCVMGQSETTADRTTKIRFYGSGSQLYTNNTLKKDETYLAFLQWHDIATTPSSSMNHEFLYFSTHPRRGE